LGRLFLVALFFNSWFSPDYSFGQQGNWEHNWLKTINVERSSRLDDWAIGFSNSVLPISLAIPISDYFISKNEKPDRQIRFLTFYAGLGLHATISYGLKWTINRQRPFERYSDLENVVTPSSGSFPSGHTGFAFHTATLIFLEYPEWYVALPSYAWAIGVGYSRMHLGVHYPTDVFAGMVLGTASGFFSNRANLWLQKKLKRERTAKVSEAG
jgi:membrane-associated phospholipid phosphatase